MSRIGLAHNVEIDSLNVDERRVATIRKLHAIFAFDWSESNHNARPPAEIAPCPLIHHYHIANGRFETTTHAPPHFDDSLRF